MSVLTKTLKNIDLRNKILFTMLILIVYRIGTFITVPGINNEVLYGTVLETHVLGFLDALSGGALANFSIFALSITPYITASIIVQLLQMDVVPTLAEWAKEGETGKRKLQKLTRYLSLILAFFQAIGVAIGFNFMAGGILLETQNLWVLLYIGMIMTAGTAMLLFLADQITAKGIGNGTSMLIISGIMSGFPSMFAEIYRTYLTDVTWINVIAVITIIALMLLTIIMVVYLQSATRKLPIQYANRHSSAQLSGQKDSFIPFKLNSAGVIPVIFASSIMSLPLTVANFFPDTRGAEITEMIFDFREPMGLALYVVLIGLFTFFYAFVQVNPEKISENLKKQGSYIPGIRPGDDTENYISKILRRVTFIGATYLIFIATLPIILGFIITDMPPSLQIGGTGILIVVGVALETAKQISNKNQEKEYRGFIK